MCRTATDSGDGRVCMSSCSSDRCRGCRGRRWRVRVGDPHAMGASCYELRYCVRKCAVRGDVEDGEGVFAVLHAAFVKDDGYEVDAAGVEEGEGGRFGEELVVG